MSERIRANENLPTRITAESFSEAHEDIDVIPEKGVREKSAAPPPALDLAPVTSPPAHPSNRLVAQLNINWRVVDDALQWVLQRRKGNPRKKNSGWQDRSFCTTREGLLRCVRDYCGEVDDKAFARLLALPEFHSERELPQ